VVAVARAETIQEIANERLERPLELDRRGPDPWVERGRSRYAANYPGRTHGEELERVRYARVRSLLHIPGGNELIGEFADLIPTFIAAETFPERIPELISECGPDVSPLEAVRDADHALGEQVDAPPQMRESEIDQLAFHLMPLGFFLSCLRLNRCSLDQVFDEGLHVTHGRCRAPVAERALQIGAKPEADLCRRIGGKLSLGPSDHLAEPGLSSLGILGADRDVR
jgi:hypothetical protein